MKRAKPQKSITMRGQPAFDWQLDERSTREAATTLASIPPPQARRRWGLLVTCVVVNVSDAREA